MKFLKFTLCFLTATLFAQTPLDPVFFLCNGEEIYVDTLDLINNPEEFFEYIESLNCAEAEDWLNENINEFDQEPNNYFSWDCIYNYPVAESLYSDFGNPEASAQLEEYCLAVANGDWMWGEDPNEWPITCEEGTSIATVEFETSGIGFQEEISWSLEGYEGEVGLSPVCLADGCLQFDMFDSWGDGWSGITFTINSPNGVLLTGSLEDGFVQSLPFGLNTSELCFDLTDVENPDAFTCFEDVFPGIGELDFELLYPNMVMTENDLFFITEDTGFDFSVFTENGIEFTPQEIDGFLIFGPIDINDLITFILDSEMDGNGIPWGFFRPANDEVISLGTVYKDNVVLPSNFEFSVGAATTVVDIILNSPDHTVLATAVSTAGLIETLSSDGPFTVFAPTDAAFAALPEGTLDELLADSSQLASVLTHHVHSGAVISDDLTDGMMIPTVNETSLEVSIPMSAVYIDGALVSIANIEADNGIVHVIDAVLIPNNLSINEDLTLNNNTKYLYSFNILGKKVERETTGIILFDVYSSGKVIKRVNFLR